TAESAPPGSAAMWSCRSQTGLPRTAFRLRALPGPDPERPPRHRRGRCALPARGASWRLIPARVARPWAAITFDGFVDDRLVDDLLIGWFAVGFDDANFDFFADGVIDQLL